MEETYKGSPDHHNYDFMHRIDYHAPKTYSRDNEALERLKIESLFHAIMHEIGDSMLAKFEENGELIAAFRAIDVATALKKYLFVNGSEILENLDRKKQ